MTRDSRSSSNRTALNYYVPLFVTLGLATGALAAWVLRERDENSTSNDDDNGLAYSDEPSRAHGKEKDVDAQSIGVVRGEDGGVEGFVRGVIRRTPSPQQVFEQAKGQVSRAATSVLKSIREDDQEGFGESERWREEAAIQRTRELEQDSGRGVGIGSGKSREQKEQFTGRRKTVAIVLDADVPNAELQQAGEFRVEDASLLSHLTALPGARLFILLHTPHHHSRDSSGSQRHPDAPPSMGSSYSAISTPAQTPAMEHVDPIPHYTPAMSAKSGVEGLADSLKRDALRLVDRESMVMPFETKGGWVHMLKHLKPDVVYVVDGLAGERGQSIEQIRGWVGQVLVIVGEATAGLADTEDEGEGARRNDKEAWWEHSEMVGLGKGVEVVEAGRLGEDYVKRVGGRE